MTFFDQFIAIDWSGAKGSRHKSIEIAVCTQDNPTPLLVLPPDGVWSRTGVLAYLTGLAQSRTRALIGFDFSFAPPFDETHGFLPGVDAPKTGQDFWRFVEEHCADDDLGAASFLEHHFRSHFYFGKADGEKARYMRLRVCEQVFNAQGGGKPSSIFDAIGAAQVAKASFAGMRVLNAATPLLPVWPFNPVPDTGPLIVEIYCRAFIRHAGLRGLKVRTHEVLAHALSALGAAPPEGLGSLTDHATDALIASAGLRALASQPRYWAPKALTPDLAATEGWTFGVD